MRIKTTIVLEAFPELVEHLKKHPYQYLVWDDGGWYLGGKSDEDELVEISDTLQGKDVMISAVFTYVGIRLHIT